MNPFARGNTSEEMNNSVPEKKDRFDLLSAYKRSIYSGTKVVILSETTVVAERLCYRKVHKQRVPGVSYSSSDPSRLVSVE